MTMYARCWTGRESAKTFTSHSGVDVVVNVVVVVVVDFVVAVVVVEDNGQHLIGSGWMGPGWTKP